MRSYRILKNLSREFFPLMELSRLPECQEFLQHGDTTVLLHCVAVAYFSLWLMHRLHLRCNEKSLIRGALLHDYFYTIGIPRTPATASTASTMPIGRWKTPKWTCP